MSQLTSVVINDRAPTPVAHTFTPEGITNGVASLVESSGVPIGNNRITASLTKTKDNGRYKPSLRFTFPVVQNETINGVVRPAVVRTAYAEVTFTFDPSSSTVERRDVVGMVQNALSANLALFNDLLVKLEPVF